MIRSIEVDDKTLCAILDNKKVFEIPTREIINCAVANNDLVLEFNDEAVSTSSDVLTGMRLYVHQPTGETNPLEVIYETIRPFLRHEDQSDEIIIIFPDLPFYIPRGRYSAYMTPKEFKLHGNSYNYSIRYQNIPKVFFLEMPDKESVCVVFSLEKPLRQGNTKYKYAVIKFKKDLPAPADLALKAREETLKKEGIVLPEKLDDNYFEVFLRVYKAISKQNVIVPGDFKTSTGETALSCIYGANKGHLFIMAKSLLFIDRKVIYIGFNEIARVDILRGSTINKTFDFELFLKSGQNMTFSSIDKKDLENLKKVFSDNEITVNKNDENDKEF